jgi:nucleotide-binding universal stress UspA family protein
MTLHRVLLAVGPGDSGRIDRLAETAIEVAAPAGATVVLAHVFTREEYADSLDTLEFDTEADEVSVDEVAARHSTIRELVEKLEAADVAYEIRGGLGPHGETIVELAEEEAADRVVVGGRRRSPTGKAVFGSTAQEVLLNAPCPVTFVRAEPEA